MKGIKDRLVLGTVQLGVPYGRNRGKPLMSRAAAWAILDAAWELGVRTFDTAVAYGEAPERLATWLAERGILGKARVVTKVSIGNGADVGSVTATAIERFRGCAHLALLTHGAVGGARWSEFVHACAGHGVEAGQSVYGPDEVRAALLLRGVQRVQAPGNVLDRRAWTARGGAAVPLDVRSVFLQGVLLDDPVVAEQRVKGGGALARIVRRAASAVGEGEGQPAAELLVAAALHLGRPEDRVVVGVDSPDQLAVLDRATRAPEATVQEFCGHVLHGGSASVTSRQLDPRTW